MSENAPTTAVIRFRCEPATAARLASLGVEVETVEDCGPVADHACPIDSEVFAAAAVRSEPWQTSDALFVDLCDGALVLVDGDPGGYLSLSASGRPVVPPMPELRRMPLTPFRLPSHFTLSDAPVHLLHWVQQLPEPDLDKLADSLAVWRNYLEHAKSAAEDRIRSVMPLASAEELARLDRSAKEIHRVCLFGTTAEDGIDVDFTPMDDKAYLKSVEQVVNENIRRIYETAELIEKAAAERAEREKYRTEIEQLVNEHLLRLSDRLRMVVEAGMLDQSTGIARAELLELLRPGWQWTQSAELKEAVNPPEEALSALIEARRGIDPGISLAYWSTGRRQGRYVLVAEFLGRSIVGELNEIGKEAPLAEDR